MAVLDGSFEGSIATNIPVNTGKFMDDYKRIVMSYNTVNASNVSVLFQLYVPENASGPVTVYLDNVEIFAMGEDAVIDRNFMNW